MHIRKYGEFYHLSLITGPSHNTLLIELAPAEIAMLPSIEALPPIGNCAHGSLDPDVVRASVLAGVEEANRRFHSDYRIKRIKYVSNDSPRKDIYHVLGYALIAHLEQEEQSDAQ